MRVRVRSGVFLLWLALSASVLGQQEKPPPTAASLIRSTGSVRVQDLVVKGPQFDPQQDAVAPSPSSKKKNRNQNGKQFKTSFLPWTLAQKGQVLRAGAHLKTGADSRAVLSLPDGVQLQLDSNTHLVLPPTNDPSRLRIIAGRAWLKTDRPLNIDTPKGPVSVTGTELTLSAGTSQVSLAVAEGSVDFGPATATAGQGIDLSEVESEPKTVEVELEKRLAWVGEGTAPESFLLAPFYASSEERNAARQDGDSLSLARVYMDEERPEEALEIFEDQDSPGPEWRHLEARLALLEGDYSRANKLLSKIPQGEALTYFDQAVVAWSSNRLDEARESFEKADNLADPSYLLASEGYLLDYQEGRYREAASKLEKALEKHPDISVWHRQLGDIYSSLSRYGAAVDHYKEALTLNPEGDPSTSLRMGTLLTKIGRREEALEAMAAYQEQSLSEDADVHYALSAGYTSLNQGKLDAAWSLAEQALKNSQSLDPGLRYLAYDLQGLILTRRRAYRRAARRYRQALELSPDDPFIRNDLALALSSGGDQYEALKVLVEAKQAAPNSAIIRTNLGALYSLLGQTQRAQTELQTAARMLPNNGRVMEELGLVFSDQDVTGAGERLLLQSNIVDPLLIAPKTSQYVVDAEFDSQTGGIYTAGWSGNNGPTAAAIYADSFQNIPGEDTSSDFQGVTALLGSHLTERDRVALQATYFNDVTEGQVPVFDSHEEEVIVRGGYYRELGPKTSLWATVGRNTIYGKSSPADQDEPGSRNTSSSQQDSLDVRIDHELSPTNTLRAGYAFTAEADRNDNLLVRPLVGTGFDERRAKASRFWLADDWEVVPGLTVVGGLNFDSGRVRGGSRGVSTPFDDLEFDDQGFLIRNRGFLAQQVIGPDSPFLEFDQSLHDDSASAVNPYLGLTYRASEETTFSLQVTRESDIPQRVDPDSVGLFNLLAPVLTSSNTLYPVRENERFLMSLNSLTGQPLPYWDYRAQLRQDLGPNLFLTAEVHQTDIFSPDLVSADDALNFENSFTDQQARAIRDGEKHRLRGGLLNLEFWNGGDLVGTMGYRYRDYKHTSGPFLGRRWVNAPEHELEARLLKQLTPGIVLELNPTWESSSFEDRLNARRVPSKTALTPFVHWQPNNELLLSLGWQDAVSTLRQEADGRGPVLRCFLNF